MITMGIDLLNVRYSHPDRPDLSVINIAAWSLAKGECVFVHGPSGSGKSTLLNLLSGLISVKQGQINVLGQRLDKMTNRQRDRFRASNIGYVFQLFNLIPYLDAVDNVRLARQFSQFKRTHSSLSAITDLLSALNVSDQDWRKPIRNLSVGQQQRVAIVRALINKPGLLIVDEPTSSLDGENRDIFMSLLMSIVKSNGINLVFVSHDLSLSSYFERVEALSDFNDSERVF